MSSLRLASRSPRRAELLRVAGIPFELGPFPDVDESLVPGAAPDALVEELARRKAGAAMERCPNDAVLAADTLVFLDGDVLGKPVDASDAARMLRLLSGRTHEIRTGVALGTADGRLDVRHATTRVTFRDLTDAEIDAYISTGEPLDKAGAYGIQGGASGFAAGLDGDLDNVIGLPVRLVREMLADGGVEA